MKKLICFVCFTALSLTSCSSGGDSSSESDVLVNKYVETYALDGSSLTSDFTYNGKKLVSVTDSDGYHEEYSYSGNFITGIQTFDDSDTLIQSEILNYNGSGQLVTYILKDFDGNYGQKETFVYNSDGTVSVTTLVGDTSAQTDALNTGVIYLVDGEVSQVVLHVTDAFDYFSTQTYTYDTKNNPFKNITGISALNFVQGEAMGVAHNILTDHYTDTLSSDETMYTTAYTYNSLNFPLTASEIQGTDATSVISTVYTYN